MPIFPSNSLKKVVESVSTTKAEGSPFVQVPLELMMREDISPVALKLYMFLLYYCGPKSSAWPSQQRLAERMNLSERRIRTILQELVEGGLVFISHNIGTSNTYHLRKFQLKTSRKSEEERTEQNNRGERNNSSAYVHDLESIKLCEDPSQNFAQAKNTKIPEIPTTQDTEQIQELFKSVGISAILSQELTLQVLSFKRDISYVKQIIDTSRSSKINNPVGFIRFMVLRNAIPVTQKSPLHSWQYKARNTKTSLDFEKYTTGKYAYLSNNTLSTVAEIAPASAEEAYKKECQKPNPPEEISLESTILEAWIKAKTLLRMVGNVPEKILQHLKAAITADGYSVQIYYPVWLSLSTKEKKYISDVFSKALENAYPIII